MNAAVIASCCGMVATRGNRRQCSCPAVGGGVVDLCAPEDRPDLIVAADHEHTPVT
jgi:hypothetical protein